LFLFRVWVFFYSFCGLFGPQKKKKEKREKGYARVGEIDAGSFTRGGVSSSRYSRVQQSFVFIFSLIKSKNNIIMIYMFI